MKREVITSKIIKSIGYGFYSSKLEIEFITGEIIQFYKVPKEIFHSFKMSEFCNNYYEKYIKGIFMYNIVSEKY